MGTLLPQPPVPAHSVDGDHNPLVHSVPQTQLETDARGSHPNFEGGNQALFEGSGQRLRNFPIWYLRKLPPPGCFSLVTMTKVIVLLPRLLLLGSLLLH